MAILSRRYFSGQSLRGSAWRRAASGLEPRRRPSGEHFPNKVSMQSSVAEFRFWDCSSAAKVLQFSLKSSDLVVLQFRFCGQWSVRSKSSSGAQLPLGRIVEQRNKGYGGCSVLDWLCSCSILAKRGRRLTADQSDEGRR
ncbi:unnamed protein product [Cuscuta europaea]|uniref:Uncharacterized protein n=1 Tax=Cuscuta europaea TaxID=41803 RepID=A0A9P0ZAM9_CUSEU|nr:unnamed protein product [Cuscuta europaea]